MKMRHLLAALLLSCGSAMAAVPPVFVGPNPGNAVDAARIGAANGVAPTDANGDVPLANLNIRGIAQAMQSVYPGTVAIVTQPVNLQNFQRTAFTGGTLNRGTATAPVTLQLPAAANVVEEQLVDATTGAVIYPWTTIATGVAIGQQTLQLNVPARAGWDRWQLRFNTDPGSVIVGTTQFGAGDLHLLIGQSLAVAMFVNNVAAGDTQNMTTLGITPSPFSSAIGSWGTQGIEANNFPAQWGPISATGIYNSAWMGKFVNYEVALTNVNQSVVNFSIGGASSTNFLPTAPASQATGFGGINYYTALQNLMTQTGNRYLDMIMRQGHQDANVNLATAAWVTNWQTIINGMQAQALQHFNRVYATIPSVYSCYAGGLTMASTAAIRVGGETLVAEDLGSTLVQSEDVAPGLVDCVHPLQASLANFDAAHYFRAVAAVDGFRPLADSDVGPKIVNVAWTPGSTTMVLTLAQNQGTALTGVSTIANQFQVFDSGATTTQFTPSSVVITDATHVTLTFASAPTPTSGALDLWVRPIFDTQATTAAGIYDNATDAGDGITQGRELYIPSLPITTTPNFTNLLVQFDMTKPTGEFFTDTGCTTQATPTVQGTPVQCAKNLANGSPTWTAPTPSQAPLLTLNAINGNTGLCFNSALSQVLKSTTDPAIATMNHATVLTASMAQKALTVANADPFTAGLANNTLIDTFAPNTIAAAGPNLRAVRSSDTLSTSTLNTAAGSVASGAVYKSVFRWGGFGAAQFFDVNNMAEVTSTAAAGTDTSTWNYAQMGALPVQAGGNTFYYNGCIGELEVENNLDSAATSQSIRSYYNRFGS